jgi:hypothetical protein
MLLDGEHTPTDPLTIMSQLQACAAYNTQAVARPPIGETHLIKQLLDLGQQELVAKGAAMHEAVEGGDFVEIEIAAMSRLQMPKDLESWQGSQKESEVINYLNGRYGTFGRNYLFAVIGGNPAVPQKSWVVYSVRSRSPDYFKLRDQIEQLRSERDQQARTFIAAIR